MYALFIEGWDFEQKGQVAEAITCYKRAKDSRDQCAIFHWNCIDRYGMLGQPINYFNEINWNKFTLTPEESEFLLSYYRGSKSVESFFRQAIVHDIMKNIDDTLTCLKIACAKHYGPACCYLGTIYRDGRHGVLVDYVQAESWYLEASKHGFARAESILGDLYADIYGNYNKAIKWYQLAGDHGDIMTWCDISVLYKKGLCGPDDIHQVVECCKKIANFPEAQYILGMLYCSQTKDEDALKYFILSAEQGYVRAQFQSGLLHQRNSNVKEAIRWYIQASDQGHKNAQYNLGLIYEHDDLELALKYFILAANSGDLTAQKKVIDIYRGINGTPINIEKARHYCKLLSDRTDQNNLVGLYFLGLSYRVDEPIDYNLAFKYYKLASDQKDIRSMFDLACLYHDGLGVLQDQTEALKLWHLCAEQEEDDGVCYNIATVYFNRRDYNNSIKWYQKRPNHNKSLYQLGIIYKNGHGVPIDYEKAFEYFKQASDKVNEIANPDKNDKSAFRELALAYYYGRGTSKNYDLALKYFQQAERHSDVAMIQNYQNIIISLLNEYIQRDTNEGVSYLFFSNLLGYLTQKHNYVSWDDPLLRRWITEALMNYFKIIKPNFDQSIIDQWYDDFY